MARRKQVEGQLSIFDVEDVDLFGSEEKVDDQRSVRRDDGGALQSGAGSVDGRVGEQSAGVAGTAGGDAVRVDSDSGVRPAVWPDRNQDVGGRGDGATAIPERDQPVSDVSGRDGDGQGSTAGTGSVAGGGGPGPAAVVDAPAVAGGQTSGAADRDGLSVDDRSGYGADSGDDDLAGTGQFEDGGLRGAQQLTGDPVDWAGTTLRPSGFQTRLDANIAALETLDELENGTAYASEDQQRKLARWSSWGALQEVFDPTSERV